MAIFILLIVTLIAFVGYRVHRYKKQRQIEEMASDAQAYVSSEIVEMLQQLKALIAKNNNQLNPDMKNMQEQIRNMTENMVCHTDSEASVREYLSGAKQDIALLKVRLDKISKGQSIEQSASSSDTPIDQAFDALK